MKQKKSASKPAPKRVVVPDPLSLEGYGVPAPKFRTIATTITHGRTDAQTFSGSKKPARRK